MLRRFRQWLNNTRAVVLAVAVHVLVLGVLAVNFQWTSTTPKSISSAAPAKTQAVDSKLIQQEMQRLKQKEIAKKKREEEQRKKAEREKKRKAEQEKKRLAEKKKREKAAKEKKRKLAEKKKREKAVREKKRKLAEKRKQEKIAKEKKLAEQKRKAELEKRRKAKAAQAQRQKEIQAALAAEETASLIEHYESLINQHVQDRWDVPPDASIKIGMSNEVTVQLLPSGDILSLSIKKSSGNKAFDDAALKAIRRAEPLPLPPASENLFKEFRIITIPFVLRNKKT